ncbi:MAG: ankyrin repeat domain-containing protein [Verrucomicrobia bacterium]|nr:ankyrin repeat domain-containing protein [Verrucomicrobiota bacterium]
MVIHRRNPPLGQCGVLLLAAMLAVGCDTPQKQALKELARSGIEPSGPALVRALLDHDTALAALLLEAGVYTEQRDTQGRTPLAIAVENHDLAAAFMLLNAHANVDATVANHACVLGIAVARGDAVMAAALLDAGARAEGLMPDGEKVLPWAIRQGRLELVKMMMKAGADPHLKDRRENPLLHVAMESGRRDLMDALIQLGADPGATNAAGETTIHLALRQGWIAAVAKLAAAGADPNAAGPDGRTLLEQAVAEENPQRTALLLSIGADPNHRQNPDRASTPLQKAFDSHRPDLLEVFLKHGAKPLDGDWNTWLWRAFRKRDLDKARLLLAHAVQASHLGPDGLRLLETAAHDGQCDFVKLLLDYGCPAGRVLYLASARGDHHMVSLLLACGVSPGFTQIPTRDTALSAAIRGRHDHVAELLVQHGALTHLSVPEGQTAFHLAIATGCHRTVQQLLASGANPNAPFVLPVSPTFLRQVRSGVMRWLLKMDRNVTPLMVAIDSGNVRTAQALIHAGAKTHVRTRFTELEPLNLATERKDVKMMRLLLGRDPYNEERAIEVSLSEQRARLLDAENNEIFSTRISTGRRGFDTPTGEYVITNKHREWTSTLYHASMPYFQRLSCGNFGLHQGYVPGYPASHGCIRVPADKAAKLFSLTRTGDRVTILP